MARRRGKEKKTDSYPQLLTLAEKWAKQMGKEVERGKATLPDGKEIPVLFVSHGPRWVIIRKENDIIIINVFIEVPDEVRERIKTLDPTAQDRFLLQLKYQLLSNARTGWYPEPKTYKKPHELKKIIIEQRIRLSKMDHSSFNRYADALQEVVTVGVRVMILYGIIPPESTGGESTDIGPPPDSMYA